MRSLATLLILTTLAGPARATEIPVSDSTELLADRGYPLEASIAFHKSLLHWLDSLALLAGTGLTAGKTAEAHRAEYRRVLGRGPLGAARRRRRAPPLRSA